MKPPHGNDIVVKGVWVKAILGFKPNASIDARYKELLHLTKRMVCSVCKQTRLEIDMSRYKNKRSDKNNICMGCLPADTTKLYEQEE